MQAATEQWLEQFFNYLHIERRLSPHTLSAYRRDLSRLRDYCDSVDIAEWSALTPQSVRGYVAWRHRKGAGGRSLQRELSALRSFFNYLMREQVVANNPGNDIPAPKSEKRLPNALDVDKTTHLVEIQGDAPLVRRDRALMEIIYSCGLRLAEVVGLDTDSIDRHDATVRVVGKGSKARVVPVGREALKALERWLQVRGQLAPLEQKALFVSQRGSRLSPRSVQQRLHEWGIKQGIEGRVHPHMLRHSFASHILESRSY